MKVHIDRIRLLEDFVHVKYSLNESTVVGSVRIPAAGFQEEWIPAAIKRDLLLKEEERGIIEDLVQTLEGQEIDIPE